MLAEDRNNIEKLTLAALAHLPTAVLYVHDLTGECGMAPLDQVNQIYIPRTFLVGVVLLSNEFCVCSSSGSRIFSLAKELLIKSMGLFIKGWSRMIFYWLFRIYNINYSHAWRWLLNLNEGQIRFSTSRQAITILTLNEFI